MHDLEGDLRETLRVHAATVEAPAAPAYSARARRRRKAKIVGLGVVLAIAVVGIVGIVRSRDGGVAVSTRRSPVTPAQTPGTPPVSLPPDCTVVSNRAGTRFGCITTSVDRLTPPERDTYVAQHPFGEPVYDIETNTTLIGYIATAGGIGFVPKELVDRYDELVDCNHVLTDPAPASLTGACRKLLIEQGVPDSQYQQKIEGVKSLPDILGACPTEPITPSADDGVRAASEAAVQYLTTTGGWATARVDAAARVGTTGTRFGSTFTAQITRVCGKAVADGTYEVDLTDTTGPEHGTDTRAAVAVSHFADGWRVWGAFHF